MTQRHRRYPLGHQPGTAPQVCSLPRIRSFSDKTGSLFNSPAAPGYAPIAEWFRQVEKPTIDNTSSAISPLRFLHYHPGSYNRYGTIKERRQPGNPADISQRQRRSRPSLPFCQMSNLPKDFSGSNSSDRNGSGQTGRRAKRNV